MSLFRINKLKTNIISLSERKMKLLKNNPNNIRIENFFSSDASKRKILKKENTRVDLKDLFNFTFFPNDEWFIQWNVSFREQMLFCGTKYELFQLSLGKKAVSKILAHMFIWESSLLLRTQTHAIKGNHGNKTFLLLLFSFRIFTTFCQY